MLYALAAHAQKADTQGQLHGEISWRRFDFFASLP